MASVGRMALLLVVLACDHLVQEAKVRTGRAQCGGVRQKEDVAMFTAAEASLILRDSKLARAATSTVRASTCQGAIPNDKTCQCSRVASFEDASFCTPPGAKKGFYVCRCRANSRGARTASKLIQCSEMPFPTGPPPPRLPPPRSPAAPVRNAAGVASLTLRDTKLTRAATSTVRAATCQGAIPNDKACQCSRKASFEDGSFCTPPGAKKGYYVCLCRANYRRARATNKLIQCSQMPFPIGPPPPAVPAPPRLPPARPLCDASTCLPQCGTCNASGVCSTLFPQSLLTQCTSDAQCGSGQSCVLAQASGPYAGCSCAGEVVPPNTPPPPLSPNAPRPPPARAPPPGRTPTSLLVFFGYADTVRANPAFPDPWSGSPNTQHFLGDPPGTTFDSAAVRLDNAGAAVINITSFTVTVAETTFDLWGSLLPISLQPGKSAIFAQVGGDAAFDPSDLPVYGGCQGVSAPDVRVPAANILYTVGSNPSLLSTSVLDRCHVLDNGGYDPAGCCNADETLSWSPAPAPAGLPRCITQDFCPGSATPYLGGPGNYAPR